MSESTVAAGLARGLFELAVSKGANRTVLAERTGIDPKDLADQDSRIPFAKYVVLMRTGQELSKDPALALHYGETVDMSEVSVVGLIMNASETMMHAFAQMKRFGRLVAEVEHAGSSEPLDVVLEGDEMWMVDARTSSKDFPEQTEALFARMTCGPRRFLPRPHVLEVHFTLGAPAYSAEYERIFRCPVVFGSHRNAMRMEPSLASHRVALQPRYVFGVLNARAEELLKALENSKTVRGRIESLLMPILHTGDIGMDTAAREMGVSRATLFRKLKAEGTTFEKLLDELRHKLALEYLRERKVSVNEAAYLVGFSDAAAFSRAFKRWTGRRPGRAVE